MGFKIGDKVILSPQDKQYNWKDINNVLLIGKVGEIILDDKNYYMKPHGAYHGYGVSFGSQHLAIDGTVRFVIEGRHLVKVDDGDEHDALGFDEPYKKVSWTPCDVWHPGKHVVHPLTFKTGSHGEVKLK